MARRPTHRPARALTAAAQRLDATKPAAPQLAKRPFAWQSQAFDYYDELGEVRFAVRWLGDALSRLRLVAAYQERPGAPIQVLDDDADVDVDDAEREMAWAAVARLEGCEGGQAQLLRDLGMQVFIAGEGYLVGSINPETREEEWEVISVEALAPSSRGQGFFIRTGPGATEEGARILDADALVLRVGRRHPRYADLPDSAMRAALSYCEDLKVLTASIRANAMSRIPAGILGIPEEASFGPPDVTTDNGDGEASDDPLTRDLLTHMTTPIGDPSSAAAIVPFILRMAGEDLEKVKQFTLDRPIDQLAVTLREESRRAFAASVDLPAEILVGRGDLNHWTAWNVTEEAYTIHVQPYAAVLTDSITAGYYRPALGAQGVEDTGRHLLWADPADLVSNTDAGQTALDLYDRVEITGAALRSAVGIPEDQAPDDEELARRERLTVITGIKNGARPAGPQDSQEGPPQSAVTAGAAALHAVPDAEVVEAAEHVAEAPVPPPSFPALRAAALPEGDRMAALGMTLARMEQGLRERLRVAADDTLRRALERAASRVRSYAHKGGGQARRAIEGVAPLEMAAQLGPAMLASLGTSPDALLSDTLEGLHDRWDEWVGASQREARRLVGRLPNAVEVDDAAWEARAAAEREEGWAVLLDRMLTTARTRLFRPADPDGPVGESDPRAYVLAGDVRAALIAAGGGVRPESLAAAGSPAETLGGLLGGVSMSDLLQEAARATFGEGWVWVYGDPGSRPTGPFDGHYELEGLSFRSLQDPELANTLDWPDVEYFYPGDHLGCQCERAIDVTSMTPEQQEGLGLDTGTRNEEMVMRGPGQFRNQDDFVAWARSDRASFSTVSDEDVRQIAQDLDRIAKATGDSRTGTDLANEVSKALQEMTAKFPSTSVGYAQRAVVANERPIQWVSFRHANSMRRVKDPGGMYAFMRHSGTGQYGDVSSDFVQIVLNPEVRTGVWARYFQGADSMSGFHPGIGTLREVVVHEYAHAYSDTFSGATWRQLFERSGPLGGDWEQSYVGQALRNTYAAMRSEIEAAIPTYASKAAPGALTTEEFTQELATIISGYANSNPAEAYAEAFSALHSGTGLDNYGIMRTNFVRRFAAFLNDLAPGII